MGRKSTNILGLELGSSAIKIVELKTGDHIPKLVTYGIAMHDHSNVRSDAQENKKRLQNSLDDLVVQSNVQTNRVNAALPAMNVFHTIVEIPEMPEKDIGLAIKWEAKRLVPLPIDKMALDWHALSTQQLTDKKMMKIILTAAPTEIINYYMEIIKGANLGLIGIETEINALQRSLLPEEPGTFLVIDIGATNTNMVIFSDHIPIMVRNIEVGGEAITLNIANALNISSERAKQFRDDIGLSITTSDNTHPVAKAAGFVMDAMVTRELKRFISSYNNSYDTEINNVILTGGCSHLKNLQAYLENVLELEVILGAPWNKIQYPSELGNELKKIGPQMSVAIGLALKK